MIICDSCHVELVHGDCGEVQVTLDVNLGGNRFTDGAHTFCSLGCVTDWTRKATNQ